MRKNFRRFISPNEIQKDLLCYSDGMGFEENPDFRIDRQSFQNYLIMHTLSGRLWCCQSGDKIAVNTGESILLDLHAPHQYYFENSLSTRIAWMHINGSPAARIIQQIRQSNSLPIKIKNPEIRQQILSFFELSDYPDPDIFEQSERCYSILLKILKESYQKEQNSLENARQKNFKKEIWHIISHNLHHDITVDDLARAVSLSKYHFIRTFHDVFGLSPMKFITVERMRQAKYLLTNTSETISAISEALGFTTPGYFSKMFKHNSGFSPSEYRKCGYLENGSKPPLFVAFSKRKPPVEPEVNKKALSNNEVKESHSELVN